MTLVVVIAWMALIAFWTTRPWSDTVALAVPKKVVDAAAAKGEKPPEFATFECSDLLGGASTPQHDGTLRYPPVRTPCNGRTQRRALAVADLSLGAVGLGGLAFTSARRRSRPAAA